MREVADGLKALGRDVIEMGMDDCKKAPARPVAGWPRKGRYRAASPLTR